MKTGADLIQEERARQIIVLGYDMDHDIFHSEDHLALAGACYAIPSYSRKTATWPLYPESWKPSPENRIKELVKAGALIAAEIDRLLLIEEQKKNQQAVGPI